MKVVVAIDSFKGSLTSLEAGEAVKNGIEKVCNAEVVVRPVADGGEGTMETLTGGLGGKKQAVEVTGPDGKKVRAEYGILPDGETVVMEMAQAAGLPLVKQEERNPRKATTYGVGEMIRDAISHGGRHFIIGIGGSATNDGGVGMLQALGYRFYDKNGEEIGRGIEELDRIDRIDETGVMTEVKSCSFRIACDVTNPLCGERGAVYIYGPQKGVSKEEREELDQKMKHYAEKTTEWMKKDYSDYPGTGAAGGLGFAFVCYLPNVILKSGTEIIMESVGLEEEIKDADIVVTGEGRIDSQTAMGKLPEGVAKIAKKYGKTVLAFGGSVSEDAGICNEQGIDAFFSIVRGIITLEEAMKPETARKNLELTVEQVFRLLQRK